jgi:hypothetical protein
MTRKSIGVFVLVLVSMAAGAAAAFSQETGRVGVNLGYPTVGVTWHVTDTVAVRPELTFAFGSSSLDSAGTDGSESDTWAISFGASALFYVADWDGVKGYVAPRVAFSRSSVDTISTILDTTTESTGRTIDLGAMVGAQYGLNSRVSVFGEVGLNYSNRSSESGPGDGLVLDSSSWSFSPRTAVGLIVYF